MRYAIKLIWKDGEEGYLRDGKEAGGAITSFPSYAAAMRQHEFMLKGVKDEVQSINVVKYPRKAPDV